MEKVIRVRPCVDPKPNKAIEELERQIAELQEHLNKANIMLLGILQKLAQLKRN